jgi:hypothetical protein
VQVRKPVKLPFLDPWELEKTIAPVKLPLQLESDAGDQRGERPGICCQEVEASA